MPGNRRLRLQALLVVLLILVIFYVTTAKRSTYSSPFYTRTMEAIKQRQDAEAQADVIAAEERRNDRVARLKDEHDIAMNDAKQDVPKQKPVLAGLKDSIEQKVADGKVEILGDDQKPVAGRKTAKDGKVVVDESGKGADGVAKIGNNVEQQEKDTSVDAKDSKETEEERKADAEINSILKRGPIIIFSKSYCPYSKKAKDILLKKYDIVPPPHVVELDEHAMGRQLQGWLGKSTGRSTVPNVMINGKSIGGGDDIARLHEENKLIDTIKEMGGKRIVEIIKSDGSAPKRRVRRVRA